MPDKEYIVEIFSTTFQPIGQVGPVGYKQAHVVHKNLMKSGMLATITEKEVIDHYKACLLYTSPSPRDRQKSRMPSSA